MKSVIDFFIDLSKIPRCSFDTQEMQEYLVNFAKKHNFKVKVDRVGNILSQKGDPKVCLQSHYDMVCLGDAPKIEFVKDGDILRAKNSTLGADNGMGVAMMLYCMQKSDNLECLFTSDEEVGLIGASNLELEISSPNILNIDGEDESEIYIGCAGGSDVVCKKKIEYIPIEDEDRIYRADIVGLAGGHSGVDIDKNIPSSIKVLARFLAENRCELVDIRAGERRNSIAKSGVAIFTCREDLKSQEFIKIERIKRGNFKKIENSSELIRILDAFPQGVRAWNSELNTPQDSVNLGIVEIENSIFRVVLSLRSMSDSDMINLEAQTESFFGLFDFDIDFVSCHGAWTPSVGDFSKRVKTVVSKYIPNAEFRAIHAGLECGILIAKQKESKEAVSIGPNIRFPHSLREECDLSSVERILKAIEEIISL